MKREVLWGVKNDPITVLRKQRAAVRVTPVGAKHGEDMHTRVKEIERKIHSLL